MDLNGVCMDPEECPGECIAVLKKYIPKIQDLWYHLVT